MSRRCIYSACQRKKGSCLFERLSNDISTIWTDVISVYYAAKCVFLFLDAKVILGSLK